MTAENERIDCTAASLIALDVLLVQLGLRFLKHGSRLVRDPAARLNLDEGRVDDFSLPLAAGS